MKKLIYNLKHFDISFTNHTLFPFKWPMASSKSLATASRLFSAKYKVTNVPIIPGLNFSSGLSNIFIADFRSPYNTNKYIFLITLYIIYFNTRFAITCDKYKCTAANLRSGCFENRLIACVILPSLARHDDSINIASFSKLNSLLSLLHNCLHCSFWNLKYDSKYHFIQSKMERIKVSYLIRIGWK